MKLTLDTSESPGDGLARLMGGLCEEAHRVIGDAASPADTTIFELRKSIKKLRAILRVSRPAIDRKSYRSLNRSLRDFGRALGKPRDCAVLVETLDALLEHYRPYPNEQAVLPARDALECRYRVTLELFQRDHDEHSLAARLGEIERQAVNLDLHRLSDAMLLAGIGKTYRRCRSGLQALRDDPSTQNSHDLRRQVKYAWNQMKLVRSWNSDAFGPVTADLNRLGKLLGADSDMAMLAETLQRHPEICCSLGRCEFINALAETRRIELLSAGLRLAGKLFAHTPEHFGRWLEDRAGERDG